MSVAAGLSLGESFAEFTARMPGPHPASETAAERRHHSRWQLSRKKLSDGLREALEALGPETLAAGGVLVVGSWASESIIARRLGAPPALLVTAGFERLPQMALERATVGAVPWSPLNADLTFAAVERMRADGAVVQALDEEEIARIAAKLKLVRAPAAALAFLHARANPAHEKRAAELLRAEGIAVVASHELEPMLDADGEPEIEAELWWRTALSAYATTALAEEEREIRAAFGEHEAAWRIAWATDDEKAAAKPRLESAFGLETALAALAKKRNETIVHFGLERSFAAGPDARLRDGFRWFRALRGEPASSRAFSLQPLARVAVDGHSAPSFLFETRGYEPGPMVFGKSLQPTALDVLSWRGRAAEVEGAPAFVNERVASRISEALLTLGKAASATSARRPDPAAIGEDLEALLVESVVADLVAAGLEGPFRATGPLAPAIAQLLARRRPDWKIEHSSEGDAWTASEALADWAAREERA